MKTHELRMSEWELTHLEHDPKQIQTEDDFFIEYNPPQKGYDICVWTQLDEEHVKFLLENAPQLMLLLDNAFYWIPRDAGVKDDIKKMRQAFEAIGIPDIFEETP